MRIENFENLPVWKQSRKFVSAVYSIPLKDFRHDYYLAKQIRSASVSILLNITEGFERKSNKDFARFLGIAKGSASETRAGLIVAYDCKYIGQNIFRSLDCEGKDIYFQLAKFQSYLLETHRGKK